MNVLEAAREVQKDKTKVFKVEGFTVKKSAFGNYPVLIEDKTGASWGLYDILLNAADFDFQPVQDPTKLKVDDPIEVSLTGNPQDWQPAYFANYEGGKVWTWFTGYTKRMSDYYGYVPVSWNYWRLPESK
jgi:hypothetical protein